jgi:hypothetical protein
VGREGSVWEGGSGCFFCFDTHAYFKVPTHTVLDTHPQPNLMHVHLTPTVTVTIGQWQQAQPETAPTGV